MVFVIDMHKEAMPRSIQYRQEHLADVDEKKSVGFV